MPAPFYHNCKVGILGGGQLGRMLIQSGIDLNIEFHVLDPDPEAPCRGLAKFTRGSLADYASVLRFGEDCDLITIEIENVNSDALRQLQQDGKRIFPQPEVIKLIQDKRTQKDFFQECGIPTAPFLLTETREDVSRHKEFLPAVHKLGKAGYDGRGVQVIRTVAELGSAFDAPGVLEKLIPFEKEIAVIVARNEAGEVVAFPPVEMVFHQEANLLDYLLAPADLAPRTASSAEDLARKVITELKSVGVLAVEMFVTGTGEVLVNEIAPRPHNSGHLTIEANMTSQYQQHLRAILGLPLGETALLAPSAMVNLLGEPDQEGLARYEGLEAVLAMPGVHVHLYGKKMTKPFRKMGHVTIVDADRVSLRNKIKFVKQNLKVTK